MSNTIKVMEREGEVVYQFNGLEVMYAGIHQKDLMELLIHHVKADIKFYEDAEQVKVFILILGG